jgi:hypothetical protein
MHYDHRGGKGRIDIWGVGVYLLNLPTWWNVRKWPLPVYLYSSRLWPWQLHPSLGGLVYCIQWGVDTGKNPTSVTWKGSKITTINYSKMIKTNQHTVKKYNLNCYGLSWKLPISWGCIFIALFFPDFLGKTWKTSLRRRTSVPGLDLGTRPLYFDYFLGPFHNHYPSYVTCLFPSLFS